MTAWKTVAAAAALAATMLATPAIAAEGDLGIELNKLEPVGEACRAYLLFENKSGTSYDTLRLDLVLFGADGVIARRLGLEAAPLADGRSTVKMFELANQSCDSLGRVLLNDVTACKAGGADQADCIDRIKPTSRTKVPLGK